MNSYDAFAYSLLQERPDCPAGLRSWNGSDPAQRFMIYRNNLRTSLVDALAATFPVTQALVGPPFFRAMAALFAQAQPPLSPVMALYGEAFPAFVASFPPAASLPYLGDLARLEMHYVQVYHAADTEALSLTTLATLLADEQLLPRVHFVLHPALAVLRSPYAVLSLWAAHQPGAAADALSQVHLEKAEAVLIMRQGLDVTLTPITEGAAVFIHNLQHDLTLSAAVNSAPAFDLASALELLLRSDAITAYRIEE